MKAMALNKICSFKEDKTPPLQFLPSSDFLKNIPDFADINYNR